MLGVSTIVRQIADEHCAGRLAFVLEGGYDLDSLPSGVHSVLRTLAGQKPGPLVECGITEVEEAVEFHQDAFVEDSQAE